MVLHDAISLCNLEEEFFLFCRFGADVMEMVASWTRGLCVDISQRKVQNHHDNGDSEFVSQEEKEIAAWSVLDVGTGNGLLLQELFKQG